MPNSSSPHKRGAPLGNNYAIKHGLYSRWFTRKEIHILDHDHLGQEIN